MLLGIRWLGENYFTAEDKCGDDSRDDSVSGTVAESRSLLQAELPWSPSRETWRNLTQILALYRESIFPLPHSGVTPSKILHLLSFSLSLALVSSSHDGWTPHSRVSQPVHHALRLGIKNCKPFTIASPIFLQPPPPLASPPALTPATPLTQPHLPHHHHKGKPDCHH